MAGCMTTGLKQREAGEQFSVALDLRVMQVRMIPMRARNGKSWITTARKFIMLALHDELAVREGVMKTSVVDIEVRANDDINIRRTEMEPGKAFEHCFLVFRWRRLRQTRGFRSHAGVNQNVMPPASFDQIAREHHLEGLPARQGDGCCRQRKQVELRWSDVFKFHQAPLICRINCQQQREAGTPSRSTDVQ